MGYGSALTMHCFQASVPIALCIWTTEAIARRTRPLCMACIAHAETAPGYFSELFLKVNGFDETLHGAGMQDIDIVHRMCLLMEKFYQGEDRRPPNFCGLAILSGNWANGLLFGLTSCRLWRAIKGNIFLYMVWVGLIGGGTLHCFCA